MKVDQLYLYRFDASFEVKLLRVLVSSHGDKIIPFIHEAGFLKPEIQYFIQAVKAVRTVTGKAPRSISSVQQWLHSYCHQQGQITTQVLDLLEQLCLHVELTEVADYDEVVKISSETIREVERRRIAEDIQIRCGSGESYLEVARKIQDLENIGETIDVAAVNTQDNLEALLTAFASAPSENERPIPIGIPAIDKVLVGGIKPGELIIGFGSPH